MPRAYDGGGETNFFDYSQALAFEKSLAGLSPAQLSSALAAAKAGATAAQAGRDSLASPRDIARAMFQQGVKGTGFLQSAPSRKDFWLLMLNQMMREDVNTQPVTYYDIGSGGTMGFNNGVTPLAGYGVALDTFPNFEAVPCISLLQDKVQNILVTTGALPPNTIANNTQGTSHVLKVAYNAATPILEVYNDGVLQFTYNTLLNPAEVNFGISGSTGAVVQNTTIQSYVVKNYAGTITYFSNNFVTSNPLTNGNWNFYGAVGNQAPSYEAGDFYMLKTGRGNAIMMLVSQNVSIPLTNWSIELTYQTWPQGGADGIVALFLKAIPLPV
jgi:hypothetical protein